MSGEGTTITARIAEPTVRKMNPHELSRVSPSSLQCHGAEARAARARGVAGANRSAGSQKYTDDRLGVLFVPDPTEGNHGGH